MSIYRSQYVPKYTPPEERDFGSYFDDLKHEQTMRDPDSYFKNVKVIKFDLIHHQCRGDPLEKTENEPYAIQKTVFKEYQKISKKEVVGAALGTQNETKQLLFVKMEAVMEHFLNK